PHASLADLLFFVLVHRFRPRPLTFPLFPSTTLFRSAPGGSAPAAGSGGWRCCASGAAAASAKPCCGRCSATRGPGRWRRPPCTRSEEHTSELQSRENLVCRLLLEKKNTSTSRKRPRL